VVRGRSGCQTPISTERMTAEADDRILLDGGSHGMQCQLMFAKAKSRPTRLPYRSMRSKSAMNDFKKGARGGFGRCLGSVGILPSIVLLYL
jgi:hypothetical protein